MNSRHLARAALVWVLAASLLVTALLIPAAATASSDSVSRLTAASRTGANRYNVCIVLDASGSMKYTDPAGYRYDAINQFIHLLSEQGDVLGCLAFSTGIDRAAAPRPMTGRSDKEDLAETLRQVPATGGYTNIGLALQEAVGLLQKNGDPSLPSVVLLLSDGATDMDSPEHQEKSLEQKADAIQAAHEEGIRIFCVCLNVDNPGYHGQFAEMDQVSRGTGGTAVEVTEAADLREVFNAFYDMIYGTSTTTVVDEVFPAEGKLETRFDVPAIGVEEVNIIINGHTRSIRLLDPSGQEETASRYDADGFTMLKLPNAAPGGWTLLTEGVPGDQIKVNMVYNSSMTVALYMDPDEAHIDTAQHVTFTAFLRDGTADRVDVTASEDNAEGSESTKNSENLENSENSKNSDSTGSGDTSSPLAGYDAVLNVKNPYGDTILRYPMEPDGNRFVYSGTFREGTCYFTASVTGNYLNRETDALGPVTFGDYIINTAPQAVNEKIVENIAVYPFSAPPSYTLDLSTLARDPEGGDLRYSIVSTPFTEGTDYTVEDNILYLDHFSIRKGAFTIRATDEYGLSCDIEVLVRTHNVGLLALLGTGLLVLLGLALLYFLYDRIFPPFRGEITVSTLIDGVSYPGTSRNPRRWKCPLSLFDAGDIGLDPSKSFFKAAGGREIRFLPSRPVTCNGLDSMDVRILSGAEVSVCVGGNYDRRLFIRFDSRVPQRHRRGDYSGGAGRRGGFDGHARPTGGSRSPYSGGRNPYSGGRPSVGDSSPYSGGEPDDGFFGTGGRFD